MKRSNITVVSYDPEKPPKGDTDWAGIDAMSEDEILAVAQSDPDNPPATAEQLRRARQVPNAAKIRKKLGLSQAEFGIRYQVPVDTLRQWEKYPGLVNPAGRALLRTIEYAPQTVARALRTIDRAPLQSPRTAKKRVAGG